ncbi:MAG: mandelate racemase/muconate lactonizing enzyme family protein [Candidatus Rokuibacteriota bacterium]
MKITAVRTTLVDVPLERPIVSRIRISDVMTHVLVDLETDDGLVGQTYLVTFGQDWGRAVIELLRGLAAEVRGMDPRETSALYRKMWQVSSMAGRRGLAVFAISAIDTAAWDIAAKALGVPLWRLLGGSFEPVNTYASEGLWLTEDLGRLAVEAAELVGRGFRAVKMRLGRPREADDLAAARAVRDAIGPDVRLMADANQGWDVHSALRMGRKLEDAGIDLTWFEEPVPHDDVIGQARLTAELATPLATGENAYAPFGFRELIEARAVDVMMPDLERIGGVTGWLRTAALADAWRLPLASHLFPEQTCHLMAASSTAYYLEHMPWAQPLLSEKLELVDGRVRLPSQPGLGLAWDRAAIKRWAVR